MRLQWDKDSERLYETGIDRMVLYPRRGGSYLAGVAWNGITALNERPSGSEISSIFANNGKYLQMRSSEDFGCTLEAYAYPSEFVPCIGAQQLMPGVFLRQQKIRSFGISYRTLLGNDEEDLDYGYKIHLVYGCEATPSEKSNQTMNDSPEPVSYSWEITSSPARVGNENKPTAHLIIDSTKIPKSNIRKLENILYGTVDSQARLPMPAEVFSIADSVDIYFDDVVLVIEGAIGDQIQFMPDGSIFISPEYVLELSETTLTLKG